MSSYPQLTEMGVLHPEQIARYSVSSIDYIDYLRIVYKRPKGSLLPVSRTYDFPRVQKTAKASNSSEPGVVMESSPTLVAVLDELKRLCASKAGGQDTTATMLEELHRLECDMASHLENLRSLIDRIKQSD